MGPLMQVARSSRLEVRCCQLLSFMMENDLVDADVEMSTGLDMYIGINWTCRLGSHG